MRQNLRSLHLRLLRRVAASFNQLMQPTREDLFVSYWMPLARAAEVRRWVAALVQRLQ